jgi:DNA-binding HxlR family transcriptional regulator
MDPKVKSPAQQICPIDALLSLIGRKWTVEILREVAIRPVRTRQFLACIPGLSMKSLTGRLKDLESNGLIMRIDYNEQVPHVEYQVTQRGRRLFEIMISLKQLSEDWVETTCKCPMSNQLVELTAPCGKEKSNEFALDSPAPPTHEFDCPLRRSCGDQRRHTR